MARDAKLIRFITEGLEGKLPRGTDFDINPGPVEPEKAADLARRVITGAWNYLLRGEPNISTGQGEQAGVFYAFALAVGEPDVFARVAYFATEAEADECFLRVQACLDVATFEESATGSRKGWGSSRDPRRPSPPGALHRPRPRHRDLALRMQPPPVDAHGPHHHRGGPVAVAVPPVRQAAVDAAGARARLRLPM